LLFFAIVLLDRSSMTISIKTTARIGGLLYLIIIIAGIFAEIFVRSRIIVPGNATATANNIIASEGLWRIGFAGSLVMLVCDVIVSIILYVLLKPTGKRVALLSTSFRLISISTLAINLVNHFGALFPLSNPQFLDAFSPNQLHVLTSLSIKAFSEGYNVSLVFFSVHCLLAGYLIFKSEYLPKFLGILLIVCSLCYSANSFAWFLLPRFATIIFPGIMLPCLVAELSLCLWLIIVGVNFSMWNKQAMLER